MSTRSKKTTTTTTMRKEAAATPTQQTSSSSFFGSPGRNRPPSPTMISRQQEKHELAGLNDRLAAYIDRVRYLETENSHLSKLVHTSEETVRRETTNIKALYEKELSDARALLDETARQRAKLQLEATKNKEDLDVLRDRYERQSREVTTLQKRILSAESQVNDLQARLSDALGQRKHWEDEYNKMKKENDSLAKQLAAAKKQLEDEMVRRVDLENKAQSLKEELQFKLTIHEQEMNETISRSRVEVEETDSRLQQEFDSKLVDSLQELRSQNETMIRITREESEDLYEKKLADLRDLAERNSGLASRTQEEMTTFRRRIATLNSELSKLRALTANQESRISDLESQLSQEQDDHKLDVDRRDGEIRRLHESLNDQLAEYRDLMDIKIQLDGELLAYRKLLEGEESRLNLSQSSDLSTPGKGSSRRTPSRATPVSRKRKRTAIMSGDSSSLSRVLESTQKGGYSSSSSAKGSVEIYEVDTDGKYIKLFNSSDSKDQHVGGWTVHLTGGDEETTYKFYRSCQIKAEHYITVWSADLEDVTHQPPTDIVMKSQKWFAAEAMKAVLKSNQGEEMASRELQRSQMRTSYTHSAMYSRDEIDQGEESRDSEGRDSNSGGRSWFWWNK